MSLQPHTKPKSVLITAIFLFLVSVSGCFWQADNQETNEPPWYNRGLFRPIFGDFSELEKSAPLSKTANKKAVKALSKRGKYLVNASACGTCHGVQHGEPGAQLAGGLQMRDRFGVVIAPNITPDKKTGIGAWSIQELVRAIRTSIDREGRPLSIDLHETYRWMSDRDAKAISVYLLFQDPINNNVSRRHLGGFERNRYGLFPQHKELVGYVPDITPSADAEYGRYLSFHVTGCQTCHTSKDRSPNIQDAQMPADFAGSAPSGGTRKTLTHSLSALFNAVLFGFEQKDSKPNDVTSLLSKESQEKYFPKTEEAGLSLKGPELQTTPPAVAEKDEVATLLQSGTFPVGGPDIRGSSGLKEWTEQDIVNYLDSGHTPGQDGGNRVIDGRLCPWPFYKDMTDDDKLAISRYLKAL